MRLAAADLMEAARIVREQAERARTVLGAARYQCQAGSRDRLQMADLVRRAHGAADTLEALGIRLLRRAGGGVTGQEAARTRWA